MAFEAFTEPWLERWVTEIRASEAYRHSAASWEGTLGLEVREAGAETPSNAVFLDLWHGDCRGARLATAQDLETATFVLRAPLATWKQVLAGRLDPIFGLMTGKLKLSRGNVAKLTPYMQASKDLVAAAAKFETTFPD